MRHFPSPRRVVPLVAVLAALVLPSFAGAAPTPTNLRATNATTTSISVSWSGPSATFGLYRNGRYVANTKTLAYTFTGLSCGTSYALGVRTFLGGGDASALATVTAQTAGCSSPPPPTATPPANTALPTITGTTQSGSTLTAARGTWTGTTPMSYTYAWARCDSAGGACATVAGASGQTYVLGTGDVGRRIRVTVSASNAGGTVAATSAPTASVTSTGTPTPPPPTPTPPPPGSGTSVVLVDRAFVCTGAVNLDLVKVTMRTVIADAVSLGTGCTGRIGRVEVDTWTSDGIKVQNSSSNAAHDVVIESGYVECHDIAPGVHQDGIQAMGGRNLTFRNLTVDCLGNGNLFVNTAGSGATTPTDVVCEYCLFGSHAGTPVYILGSVRSGARYSYVCTGTRWGRSAIFAGTDSVDVGNTILPSSDPRCV